MEGLTIRHLEKSDYPSIISVINDWWGGRNMVDMLPKIFFIHFRHTSFAAEIDYKIVGFLSGFISQNYPDEAYAHFLGVHPGYRKLGIGRKLYMHFFDAAKNNGCQLVRSITSPVNTASIAFHRHLGFSIEQGDGQERGIQFTKDYDGVGQDRVLFAKVWIHSISVPRCIVRGFY